jgi:hypothetical protein
MGVAIANLFPEFLGRNITINRLKDKSIQRSL